MNGSLKWPWTQSLALSDKGNFYEVTEILSGGIRTHLAAMGIETGSALEYLGNDASGVWIRVPGGRSMRIERNYSWFIIVELAYMDTNGAAVPIDPRDSGCEASVVA